MKYRVLVPFIETPCHYFCTAYHYNTLQEIANEFGLSYSQVWRRLHNIVKADFEIIKVV